MSRVVAWAAGVSAPAWLWAAGLLLAAGVGAWGAQTWRLHTLQAEHQQLVASVAADRAARTEAARLDETKTAGKEQVHAGATLKASDEFTTTQPARDAALRADLDRANRLLSGAEKRAAGYRAQAAAGASACSRLADRSAALDRQLAEGVGVVGELRGALDRRDAEVMLLGAQIDVDRALLVP